MKPPGKKTSWSLSSVSSHHQCYNLQIQFCVWLDDRDPVLFNEFFFSNSSFFDHIPTKDDEEMATGLQRDANKNSCG